MKNTTLRIVITILITFLLLNHSLAESRLEGIIEHLIIDHLDKSESFKIRIRTEGGEIYELPESLKETFPAGVKVSFSPNIISNTNDSQEISENVSVEAEQVEKSSSLYRVLTVKVNFTDDAVSCKNKKLNKILMKAKKNVHSWFLESSFNKQYFEFDSNDDGNVDISTVTINASVTGECDYDSWANLADQQLVANGISTDNYEHLAYILPGSTNCDWGGLGSLACGSSCRVWLRQCANRSLFMHELGHNLGLGHASLDEDGDEVLDSEYGDYSCPMGSASKKYRHFNGPHKELLGWIPDTHSIDYSSDSHIKLAAVEIDPSTIDVANISSPINYYGSVLKAGVLDTKAGPVATEHYYVSYRVRKGKHARSLPKKYRNAISVHRKKRVSGQTTEITTLTKPNQSYTAKDGTIITFLDRQGSDAVVWVSQNSENAPTFSIAGKLNVTSGKELTASELSEFKFVLRKKYTKNKQEFYFNDSSMFLLNSNYGNYILTLKYPRSKFSISKEQRRQKVHLSDNITGLAIDVTRKD